MAQMEKGPFVFMVMNSKGTGSMKKLMLRGLAVQLAGAFLITWLVVRAGIKRYSERLLFVLIVALAAGIVCHLPEWNWWGFPAKFTALAIADLLAGWFLAGLVIAKVASK
jgi:hypothetical protein